MKSKKGRSMITFILLFIIAVCIYFIVKPEEKKPEEPEQKVHEEAPPESSEPEETPEVETGTESEEPPVPEVEAGTESEELPVPEVEHRTGEEIIGVSDKDISELHIVFYDSVNNDVTGNWRLAVISEDVEIQDYIFSYYQEYIKSKDEVHGIVNLGRNVTARINMIGDWLMVSEYDYVKGEEHDAKLLYSGTLIQSYIVYSDNGDIESAEE